MRNLIALCFCLILGFIFTIPSQAQAQIVDNMMGSDLFLEPTTPYPKPNSYVEVALNDYAYGRTVSEINWFVNGIEMSEAKNQRKVIVLMGEIGEAQEVVAKIVAGNITDSASVTLRPVFTDIILEAETRAPGFYLGRTLPSNSSAISASVIVDGINNKPEDLLYNWSVNDKPLENGVVRGKNKINFNAPEYGSRFLISVTVSDLNGVVLAKRVIQAPIIEPEVLFYETSALYGVKPIALKKALFSGETITVQAEPYNLAIATFNRPDYLVWTINNDETTNPANNPYEITLQRATANSGTTAVGFHVRDLQKLLQGAEGGFDVKI